MHAPTASSRAQVLVGVAGGIAAYKAVDLVSRLKKAGCEVHVLMTQAAQKFVAPLTFSAVAGSPAVTSVFPRETAVAGEQAYPHLYPATRAEVFVVAPATADVIARLAGGLGDDAVTTSALSLPATCRRYFAPAMNVEMWHQPVVQENVRKLEASGWIRLGPATGELACGMTGEGRMVEPADLAQRIQDDLAAPRILAGRRVLILSGPTCEYLDPVRFISNASSGRMGKALAEAAVVSGAEVQFVTGPVADANVPAGPGIRVQRVVSAEDMLAAGRAQFQTSDAIIHAAAVADYRPADRAAEKMAKQADAWALKLEATPDVAATLNRDKKSGQVAIGFALQTNDGEARAREKMTAKNFDGVVLNGPDALGGESGTYTFIEPKVQPAVWGKLAKRECARRIMQFVAARLGV